MRVVKIIIVCVLLGSAVSLHADVKKCIKDCKAEYKKCIKDAIKLGVIVRRLCINNGGTPADCTEEGADIARQKKKICKAEKKTCIFNCKNE